MRAYVEADRVCGAEEARRRNQWAAWGGERAGCVPFAAALVNATGVHSPWRDSSTGARLHARRSSVGTVARGFARGEGPDTVDFNVGEILVSTEDARDHRQLIWEGFAGARARDEYATRLFFYDAVDSPADKSLLALFERYFEGLPRYKRAGAQWRVGRPVSSRYAPPGVSRAAGRRRARAWRKTA